INAFHNSPAKNCPFEPVFLLLKNKREMSVISPSKIRNGLSAALLWHAEDAHKIEDHQADDNGTNPLDKEDPSLTKCAVERWRTQSKFISEDRDLLRPAGVKGQHQTN